MSLKKNKPSLRSLSDFFQTADKLSTPYFSIFIQKKQTSIQDQNLIAIIAPKKHFKTAVSRNFVKRRLKSAIQQIQPQNVVWQIIVVAYPNVVKLNFVEITQILKKKLISYFV